ncbi:DUF1523 family protein [Granulosicoccus antarcticus]|uniref:DUF1523 domain-containing protein n=1 Tax=Granulosicoccus antarcticus IMCC3135 TaxID=1192854 RepID=A0A2Z2NL52_9GAMM|nr:DUF1523 family protein [Granulosicoccus antarcticus]ASJ70721.1 hypothetical protein IMCC3135_03040 [Granulosicoccus antarcticus IMCC3135]
MKRILTVRNILIAIPLLVLLVGLHYALPQVDVVRAVGVEVKRVDVKESDASQGRTRDVYQLQTETPDGTPKVYRNEDNFLYGKFDSADLQTQIQSFAADKQLVALRHYGWRLKLFSTFPNAIKVWPVEEGYRHIPVFNIVVLAGIGFLIFLVYRRVNSAVDKSRQAIESARAERAEKEAVAAREAQEAASLSREAERKKDSDVDAFLNSDGNNKD